MIIFTEAVTAEKSIKDCVLWIKIKIIIFLFTKELVSLDQV